MNDQEFEQHATINPFDDTSEFRAAAQKNSGRQRTLDELKEFESGLKQTLNSVSASETLKQRLLGLPEINTPLEIPPINNTAANDSQAWAKKLLPLAACLLLAVGLAMTYWPVQKQGELAQEVLAHIYNEANLLEEESIVSMSEVNQRMLSTLGSEFKQSPELAKLKIHVAGTCWLAKEEIIHMVMEGNAGALSVLLLPHSSIKKELSISDERFEGLIIPTPGGNLVVVGEKGETISQFSRLLASNINW